MASTKLGDLFWLLGIKSTVDKDISKAEVQIDKLDGTTEKSKMSMASLADGMTKAGVMATGLGLGIVGLTDSAKKTNAGLGVTALQLGVSTEEMRDLALATTNVTFPLEEVQKSFDLLTRAGMENTDELQATATAFDTLGDATGNTASVVTRMMIPAFNAFKIPLEDAGSHTDTMTHLLRNTTIEMSDFSSAMNYLSADLGPLGISMEDTVAILEAMADKGIQGSAATREFRTAVTGAEGDVNLLYEGLGLTANEVGVYRDKLSDASGMTQDFADTANKQYGVVDNLKQAWSEWSLTLGSALEPLDMVGGALTVLGPMMMVLGPTMTLFSGINLTTVVPSLLATAAAGWAAILPWLPLVAAIGAVIVVGYLLWDNWEAISEGLGVLWEGISEIASAAWETTISIITGALDLLWDLFIGWTPLGLFISHFDEILGFLDTLKDLFYNAGKGIMEFLIDGIISLIMAPFNLVSDALGFISDLLPHSPAKTGPLSRMPNWDAYLVEPLKAVEPAMQSAATAAVTPVAVSANSSQQSTVNNNDNTLSINQITFQNPTDIQDFWRRRDEQIRRNKYQRGVRG